MVEHKETIETETNQRGSGSALNCFVRPPTLLRVIAWLLNRKVVWLEDYQKEVYATIAKKNPFGGYSCPVYFFTQTGDCILNSDGSVCPRSKSNYIKRWREA